MVGADWDPSTGIPDDGRSFFYHKWYVIINWRFSYHDVSLSFPTAAVSLFWLTLQKFVCKSHL